MNWPVLVACLGALGPIASIIAPLLGKGRAAGIAHTVAGALPDVIKIVQGTIQTATGKETVPTEVVPLDKVVTNPDPTEII